jgi:uncharacterized protein YggE
MEQETVKLLNKTFMLATILVVGILIFLVGQLAYQERSLAQQNANQVTVSGEGKVYVKPDVAVISLGVTAQGATVAEATKNGTDKMNAVIAVVKGLKVAEKDIQSTNYNLTPVYETSTTPIAVPMMYPVNVGGSEAVKTATNIVGYKLEQNIQVKIRDFATVGDILAKATASGANLVGDLQFTIDNPEQFREQARAEAIKKAKVNAKNLSKESGVDLGKLINVYENYNSYPMMYDSVAKGLGSAAPEAVSIPTIQPGQQEISLTVNLTYQVK